MKRKNAGAWLAVLMLLLCLSAAAGIMAARVLEARQSSPTPEPTPEPEATEAVVLTEEELRAEQVISPAECGHPSYADGVCEVCGAPCSHPFHSTDGRCLRCGQPVVHRFVKGVCEVCGAKPTLYSQLLPDRYYEPSDEQGSIEAWSFESFDVGRQWTMDRRVRIYTPFGYDPETRYNVLVLLHGLRATEESWFTTPWTLPDGREIEMRWIFDRMIEDRVIEPLIIVSASQYLVHGEDLYKISYEQMAQELQEVILPYVAENYSTFAENGSREALIAAREHFALGGNSWGSYFTYDTGMCRSLPFFSQFICLSGDAAGAWLVESLNSAAYRDYPVLLYYAAAGNIDVARSGEETVFYSVVPLVERLHDGENAFFHICEGGHDWGTWSIEIYNALQYCF